MQEIKIKVKSNNGVKEIEVKNEIFSKEFITLVEASIISKDLRENIEELDINEEECIIVYGKDNGFYTNLIDLVKVYEVENYNNIVNKDSELIEVYQGIDKKVTILL